MRLTEAPFQYPQGVLPFTILRDTEYIHKSPHQTSSRSKPVSCPWWLTAFKTMQSSWGSPTFMILGGGILGHDNHWKAFQRGWVLRHHQFQRPHLHCPQIDPKATVSLTPFSLYRSSSHKTRTNVSFTTTVMEEMIDQSPLLPPAKYLGKSRQQLIVLHLAELVNILYKVSFLHKYDSRYIRNLRLCI